ncbi:hypothetical protein K0M31_018704 [Melipona bicolor]|uniref:Uncharacterized protein n=1 Tax=Melipona bicolor TaxID=60889 RepID=A0AA40G3S8_9HYME|nr:hypothetical protein K0M31_018704 [Melipona bicolor]
MDKGGWIKCGRVTFDLPVDHIAIRCELAQVQETKGRTAGEEPSERSDLCSLSTSNFKRTVVLGGSLEVILEKGEASLVVRRSSKLPLGCSFFYQIDVE